jgi:hypothetical protein
MPEVFLDGEVDRVAGAVASALAAQKSAPFDAVLAAARRADRNAARTAVTAAREAAIDTVRASEAAEAAVAAARAEGRLDALPRLAAAHAERLAEAAAARAAWVAARQAAAEAHAALVEANGLASAFARLGRGKPIALLPVRVETRYFVGDARHYELRLRVFPDAAHIDDHQRFISADERKAGQHYWEVRRAEGVTADATLTAWHRLCELVGEPRAAWIAATLDPHGTDGRRHEATEPPPLPEPPVAPEGWSDPAFARALPDRWAVVGFRGDRRVLLHWGAPVAPELQVSPEPGAAEDAGIDAGLEWLTDFAAAEAAGMAMRIRVEKVIARHIDRLLVFGISATETHEEGSRRIEELLAGQVATGFGFPPHGTPTNNTELARSGHRVRPVDHLAAHAGLTQTSLSSSGGSSGSRLARALGIDPLALRRGEGAGLDDQGPISDLHRVLWYATGQRLLEDQVETEVGASEIAYWQDHFIRYVRPAGPLPLVRIGNQPYGVLPVTALDRWKSSSREQLFVNVLRTIRNVMDRFDAPRESVPEAIDPQRALLLMLQDMPRAAIGAATSKTFSTQQRADETRARMQNWWTAALPLLRNGPLDLQNAFGGERLWVRRIMRSNQVYDTERPLVATNVDRAQPLPDAVNYIKHLATRQLTQQQVRDHQVAGAAGRSVLWMLLREAYRSVPIFTLELHERFFLALHRLGSLPVSELEALTADVMGAWSHRTDAWMTSVATRRLEGAASASSHGVHVAGYAWIEGLVPPGEGAVAGAPVAEDPDSAGFMHLPSAAQARTAAVLHGAFLSHGAQGARESLRLDLSSARVRLARWLLAGLRGGQSLAALLGYRFERRLVESGLGAHIPAMRRIATAAIGPTDPADSGRDRPAADPATTEFTDGVVIAFLSDSGALAGRVAGQGIDGAAAQTLLRVAVEIAEAYDALGDVLLSEGVHHALSGNASRAAAAFDVMAEGDGAAPDPDFVKTPLAGQQVGQRICVPLSDAEGGWPGDDRRVRAAAEPRLNAWVASVLGPPDGIGFACRVHREDGGEDVVRGTLADLDLSPLDVMVLSGPRLAETPLAALALRHLAAGAEATLDADDRGGAGRSLEEGHALVYALRRVVEASRPLRAADLALGRVEEAVDEADLAARADAARAALAGLEAALSGERPDAAALLRTGALLGAADPADAPTLPAWRAEIARRSVAAVAATTPLERLTALAGRDTVVLSAFAPFNPGEITAAAADQAAMLGGDATVPRRWLHDYGRVRKGAEALDLYVATAEVLGAAPALTVAQLPAGMGVPWAGERLPEQAPAPRAAFLIHAPRPVDWTASVAGLMVDAWTDVVPRRNVITGLAFNYDAPKPQAPQVILIAVPPDPNRAWVYEDLEAALTETLDMVYGRLRPAAPEGALGDYLPALYVSSDIRGEIEA